MVRDVPFEPITVAEESSAVIPDGSPEILSRIGTAKPPIRFTAIGSTMLEPGRSSCAAGTVIRNSLAAFARYTRVGVVNPALTWAGTVVGANPGALIVTRYLPGPSVVGVAK